MVIHEIDIYDLAVVKSEDDSPIARHTHTPKPAHSAFERMQAEARAVYVCGLVRVGKYGQDLADALDMGWVEPARVVVIVESL